MAAGTVLPAMPIVGAQSRGRLIDWTINIAADCSRLQLLARAPLPIRPDRHNQQRLVTDNRQLTTGI